MKKRTMKLLSVALAMLLILLTAVPAFAETLTVHFLQDDSKSQAERFNFRAEDIELSAYLIGRGSYGSWTILDNYADIEIFNSNGGFNKNCMTQIRNRIREQGIQSVSSAGTRADTGNNGIAELQVANEGMYLVVQSGSRTTGTVRTSDMMLATNGLDDVNAKWEFTPPTPEKEEPPEERPYKLTIYYIYWDGRTAFPTYQEIDLWPGYRYDVPSPKLPGYWVSMEVVRGVMPHHDMVYTVIYYPQTEGRHLVPIEDYKTALGLGDIQMHVGVCFE